MSPNADRIVQEVQAEFESVLIRFAPQVRTPVYGVANLFHPQRNSQLIAESIRRYQEKLR